MKPPPLDRDPALNADPPSDTPELEAMLDELTEALRDHDAGRALTAYAELGVELEHAASESGAIVVDLSQERARRGGRS